MHIGLKCEANLRTVIKIIRANLIDITVIFCQGCKPDDEDDILCRLLLVHVTAPDSASCLLKMSL